MMSRLDEWRELLGPDVFFVPCERGTKKPLVTYTERPFEATQSPAYVDLFNTLNANIAVYLGAASGGLCAIDFDQNEDLARFDELNPALRATLRTKGARGAMLWLRIEGPFPDSCSPGPFEWRADKRLSTIRGLHPSGVDYQVLVQGKPLRVAFDSIHWPEEWAQPWKPGPSAALEAEFGPPLSMPARGGVPRLNSSFVVGKFHCEHDIVFDGETGRFYRYHPGTGLWRYEADVAVQAALATDTRTLVREIQKANGGDGRLDAVLVGINHPLLRNLCEQLKGAAHREGAFSKPNRVLHAANGMVDLSERPPRVRPFAKAFYSRNASPIAYDPAASCPRFLGELLAPALDEDDVALLQQWCGLALLGRNMAQVMLILSGTAAGGKGTIVNVLNGVVGEPNVHQLRTEHLDSRFETGFYVDKTLLYGPDVEPNFLNTTTAHFLKSLTGDDLLTTEVKRSSVVSRVRGDFNVILTCNSRLMVKLQGDSEAWARRLLLIEFAKPPPAKRIANFADVLLRDEGPGILNWMLEGASSLLERLDGQEGLLVTPRQRQRVSDLLCESDAARHFVATCVQRSPFTVDTVTSEELFRAYLTFCDGHGWVAMAQRSFEMKAKDLMVQLHRAVPSEHVTREGGKRRSRGYTCVCLKTDTQVELRPEQVVPGCARVTPSEDDPY
jgi:P4 family phage/plasmid primase-like protien